MKYISTLIILILFSFISSAQGSNDPKFIIGKTIKIGNLEVAQNDFPNKMNWDSAKIACERLGSRWRLPNKDEFNILYINKDKIGGFTNIYYWSSTEDYYNFVWSQNFLNGVQVSLNKSYEYYVRAIRAF